MLALRAWLQWVGHIPGDTAAIYLYLPVRSSLVLQVTTFFNNLGEAIPALAIVFVSTATLWRRRYRREAVGVLMAAVIVPINAVFKALWGSTPLWAEIRPQTGVNYPSGHVAFATSVLGYIAFAGYRHRQPEITVVALLLVVCMGPARVLASAHLITDAVGGYLLGLGWLILVILWTYRGEDAPPAPAQQPYETPAAV